MAKYDWYNELSEVFMGRGYFHDGATIQDRVESIGNLVGDMYEDEEIREKVKEYIALGYYVLPSPVWSNVGTDRGGGVSCFNTHIDDSVESIVRGNAEVGMLCKLGGGTSGYFGKIRPSGSPISKGGSTEGPVHFMRMFDTTKKVISQGSTRRGEFAAYLDVDHPDIADFLNINGEGHVLQRFPFGVCVADEWIEQMKAGDYEKRKIWAMVLDSRNRTGFPYIFFTDNVNNGTADVYKDKGMKIHSSNMCVTGDQLVVTDKGLRYVKDLYDSGEKLILFDGEVPVQASEMKLIARNEPVFKITTEGGRTHTVTFDHKLARVLPSNPNEYEIVELHQLNIGDSLAIQCQEHTCHLDTTDLSTAFIAKKFLSGDFTDIDKLFGMNREGLSDIFMHTSKIKTSNLEALRKLQIIRSNMGLYDTIVECEDGLYKLNPHKFNHWRFANDKINSMEQIPSEDVYCVTVDSDKHLWVCNSFITHNCTEILEPSSTDETFVCDLIGMNLVKRDEWVDTDAVRIAVYIADAVLLDFIGRYEFQWGIERAIRFAKRHMAIAIGASGYHSLLQSKMIPFESMEAKLLNVQIFKDIQQKAIAASEEMAAIYGKPELLADDKYRRRHTVLMAIAPNTSSSFIMEQQSQSIEPYVSNYYIKKSAKMKHAVKNPYLRTLLQENGQDTHEVWESILKNAGSVRHLSFLSEEEKMVFRTFIEISQMEVIIQASARQKYIDQGQSLNLMIHPSTPTKDVNALILKAHELGIKTLYYQLGQNAAQEFARDILSCESCAG